MLLILYLVMVMRTPEMSNLQTIPAVEAIEEELVVPESTTAAGAQETELDEQELAQKAKEEAREDEPGTDQEKEVIAERQADHGLIKMKEVLGPVMTDVTIFASTAMYLLGKTKRDRGEADWKSFHVAPGDLDAAVPSVKTLEVIRDRLARVPGVKFERDGQFGGFPHQEAKVLKGTIPVTFEAEVNGQKTTLEKPYEFEFFYKSSRILEDRDLAEPIAYKGFKFLNPGALLRQYDKNLQFEQKIDKGVQRITSFLTDPKMSQLRLAVEAGQTPASVETAATILEANNSPADARLLAEGLRDLELKADDLQNFYRLQDEIDKLEDAHEVAAAQKLIEERAIVLSGLKTKLEKRIKNVGQLVAERHRTDFVEQDEPGV